MNKNFSFTAAVKDGFNFMVNDAKTFFAAIICAFAVMWLAGWFSSFIVFSFLPEGTAPHNVDMVFKAVTFFIRTILIPLCAMGFVAVFYQKMKDKKLSNPSQKSIINLILFALAAYIAPTVILSAAMFAFFMLFSSGNINAVVFIVLSFLLFIVSIGYFIFVVFSILSPYFYLKQQGFSEGLKQSMDIVKAAFGKIFFSVLGFMILFSIINSVPNIINAVIRYMEVTPEAMRIVMITGMAASLILFAFLAFSVAVLTAIYLQLDSASASGSNEPEKA